MNAEVHIGDKPLVLSRRSIPGCGAVAHFEGIVRGEEDGREIAGLEYEAYQPMAEEVIRGIVEALGEHFPCEAVRVHHRIGFVPVGEAAIVVDVHARHRGEAFALLTEFMNRLKQEVPIWKVGTR